MTGKDGLDLLHREIMECIINKKAIIFAENGLLDADPFCI